MMAGARAKKSVCPRCRHPGFTRGEAFDGRPEFRCMKCENCWTSGRDGEPFIRFRVQHAPSTKDKS